MNKIEGRNAHSGYVRHLCRAIAQAVSDQRENEARDLFATTCKPPQRRDSPYIAEMTYPYSKEPGYDIGAVEMSCLLLQVAGPMGERTQMPQGCCKRLLFIFIGPDSVGYSKKACQYIFAGDR